MILKVRTGVYIIITFVILLIIFQAFMRIRLILSESAIRQNELIDQEYMEKYDEYFTELFDGTVHATNDQRQSVIIGAEDAAMTQIASAQLASLRENYIQADKLEELSPTQVRRIDVFIITDDNIDSEEIIALDEDSKDGAVMIFLADMRSSVWRNEDVQDILGIQQFFGETEYEGWRVSQDLEFNGIQEIEEVEFIANELEVQDNVRLYAQALLEDETVKNEDLPPLMWRVSDERGKKYICNGEVFASAMSYGVITEIYTNLQDIYIYPIVNAATFMVAGMPYASNFQSDELYRLYNRDALNVQNSIFFPQFGSSEERYGMKPTWYSPEYEAVIASTNKNIMYYLSEIELDQNEIAKEMNGELISDEGFLNKTIPWTPEFRFTNQEENVVNLPIVIETDTYKDSEIGVSAMIRSTGFYSFYVDIDVFLSGENEEWNEFCLEYETILAEVTNKYAWVDKLTASEAARRVTTYMTINPTYTYEEDKIKISIDNFNEEAFFILETRYELLIDQDLENVEVTSIGIDKYLIQANEEEVEINYEVK